ncbi:MAG: hypothetical protein HFH10_05120 [Dorea sp.]|nr:hypothetical protein [Dorea sp.]
MNLQDTEQYKDIIDLPHHVSEKHQKMSLRDRAAQFAPFAAISGHREVIMETERRHVSDDMERAEYEGDS